MLVGCFRKEKEVVVVRKEAVGEFFGRIFQPVDRAGGQATCSAAMA